MREIKFKIWNGKEMVLSDDYTVLNGKINMYKDNMGEYCFIEENVKVSQFTGIKDRNGKDIYEGDIVSGWSGSSKKIIHSKVVFRKGTYYLLTRGDIPFDYLTSLYPADENSNAGIKVIGNIYENPELLEE